MMATLTPSNCGDGETQPLLAPKQPLMSPQPPPSIAPNDNLHKGMAIKKVEPCPSSENGNVWFRMKFRTICEICVSMPLLGMVVCLIVALIFQFEHIQETACKVYNVVPSISAVTGISPGRYLWRVVIAFHIGPRMLIAAVYYNFLMSFVPLLASADSTTTSAASVASKADEASGFQQPNKAEWLTKLLKCCYYLQVTEIVGLCVISFVHNREHYPTHEKGFLLYLTSSHLSFLIILRIYHMIWPFLNEEQRWSYYKKLFIFVFSIVCISLMGYFYYRHIVHCDSFAFSIFAFAEYFVAAANMGYYWTLVNDLPDEEIVVKKPHPNNSHPVGNAYNPPKELFPNNQEIPPQSENIIPRNGHPVITAADIAVKKEL